MGVAVRGPPRLAQQPRRRRRGRRDNPVLHGRRPGATSRCSAARSTGRSPASRTSRASWCRRCSRSCRARRPAGQGTVGPGHRQPHAVAEGDQVIPMAGIWRDERFPDPAEQAKLQALSDAIDKAAGLRAPTTRASSTRRNPRASPARARQRPTRAAAGAARHLLRPGPGQVSPLPVRRLPRSTPSTSPGPDRTVPGIRTTTGCRGPGCSSSGTTPSAAPTTRTRCGATPSPTSASTCSHSTGRCRTRELLALTGDRERSLSNCQETRATVRSVSALLNPTHLIDTFGLVG